MKTTFVDNFPFSEQRRWLFQNYLNFVGELQTKVFPYFTQWLDGSFVTRKQEPKDIDVVTFLDYRVMQSKEKAIEPFWTYNLEEFGLDSYFVPVFPPEHEKHLVYLQDFHRWKDLFSNTRPNSLGISQQKGYLEVIFEKEIS